MTTRDEIIKMAREADQYADDHAPAWTQIPHEWQELRDHRFAALVAAAEREACAKVAEQFGPNRPIVAARPSERIVGRWEGEQAASSNIADAIRARGEK